MRTVTIRRWSMAGLLAAFLPAGLSAQGGPPVRGTMALEATMTKFYRALNVVVVTTVDGAEHTYHFTKGLVVHGSKGAGPDALEGLRPGTTVIVHYQIAGTEEEVEEVDRVADEGLKVAEGVVVRLDRGRRQLTLKFADGTTGTFQLTERAASELDDTFHEGGTGRVMVYYADESGHRVGHYFKRLP